MFKHKNNQITIGDLTISLKFFQQLEPAYALPGDVIGVEYVPGSHHHIFRPGQMTGGDDEWVEGDVYLSKLAIYQAAWTAAQEAEASAIVAPQKLPRWADLEAWLNGSELFAKAYSVSNQAAGAWSLLLKSIDSSLPADNPNRLANFVFAIEQIRFVLGQNDFTTEQIEQFNEKLAEYDFELTIAL